MTQETTAPETPVGLLRFLGEEVRKRRKKRGWSQDELAKRSLSTGTMISFVENGKRVASTELITGLDSAFGTDFFSRFQPLVIQHAYPTWFLPFVEMERESTRVRTYEAQVIPGLLQTEDYARAVLRTFRPDHLDDLVAARLSRQEMLGGDQQPHCWFVMDEQALARSVGDRNLMGAQMTRLLEAGEHPRTVVQVVPSTAGAHVGLAGSFTTLSFDESPDVLYSDAFSAGRMSVDRDELAGAARAYDLLLGCALSPADSADLIGTYVKEHT